MKTSILYFTRSGHTKETANYYGRELKAAVYELKDDPNWRGLFGFFRCAKYATKKLPVNLTFDESALESDRLIVITPIWAGQVVPAVHTLLNTYDHPHIDLVFINMGSDMNRIIQNAKSLYPNAKSYNGFTRKKDDPDILLQSIKNL
jgi:hypothetical protein